MRKTEQSSSIRDLFRDREFLAYFVARQSSWLAYSIEGTAIGWQIFSLRHRPFDLGLVGLTLFLPQLLLALPAGMLADRVDRKRIAVTVAFAEMLGLCAFAALALAGSRSPGLYFTAIAFVGIAHAIGAPADRSLLVNIVPSGHFVRASALVSSAAQLITVGGPALAGLLIAIRIPIAFGAAAFFYALAALGFMFVKRHNVLHDDVPLLHSAIEGVRFIFSQRIILGAISLDLFAVLFGGATALLPVFAASILHVGATGFGLLRSAPALGAAVIGVVIARKPIERKVGPLLFWSVAGFGLFTIVFGLSTAFWISLAALALTGAFDMVSVVIRNALVQLGTPDAMRGRVVAVENVFIGASNELGAFESGTVAAILGTEASVVLGGAATLVVIALWALLFPRLRKFDRLERFEANDSHSRNTSVP